MLFIKRVTHTYGNFIFATIARFKWTISGGLDILLCAQWTQKKLKWRLSMKQEEGL